jgi:hypothetical protein
MDLSLGDYLARIGAAALVECLISPREVTCNQEQIDSLLKIAAKNNWPTDVAETTHPLFCNRGRRSLARGVEQARLWLAEMDADQRRAELATAISDQTEPVSLSLPGANPKHESGWHTYATLGGWWNLGTLIPAVMQVGGNPERPVSAWVAVLAWESQQWIDEPSVKTWLKFAAPESDPSAMNSLLLPYWDEPVKASWARTYFCSIHPYLKGHIRQTVQYALSNRVSSQSAEYYLC